MISYKEYTSDMGQLFIERDNGDGSISFIPVDEANADYQAYLNKDKAEQFTPILPA
jgi:hypothetical protein